MRRRHVIVAAIALVLGLRLPAAVAQTANSQADMLVGTWALVSIYEEDDQGEDMDRWGDDPQGLFIADGIGNFMFQLVGRDVIRLAGAMPPIACRDPKEYQGIAYSGQYAIDAQRGTIAVLTKVALSREFDRTRLTASITFKGDELDFISAAETPPTGTFYAHLRWRRVRE
jgi:hypothetical protein